MRMTYVVIAIIGTVDTFVSLHRLYVKILYVFLYVFEWFWNEKCAPKPK